MVGPTAFASREPVAAYPTSPKSEMTSLETKVQWIISGILENFVPAPSKSQALENLLIGLKQFHNLVRWKWFCLDMKKKKKSTPTTQNTRATTTQQSKFTNESLTPED